MVKDVTLNDLVALLYNEFDDGDAAEIKTVLASDLQLSRTYDELVEAKKALPKITFNPGNSVINRVLLYSSVNNRVKCN